VRTLSGANGQTLQLNTPSSGVFVTGIGAPPPPAPVPAGVGPGGTATLPKPRRIYWAGLVANAFIFAAAILVVRLLARVPGGFIREVSRMRAGRCISCGYDLGYDFTHGCPECGWRRSDDRAREGMPLPPERPAAPEGARAA
jgi:hypothetical protein